MTDELAKAHINAPRSSWIGELENSWIYLVHRSFSWVVLIAAAGAWWLASKHRDGGAGPVEHAVFGTEDKRPAAEQMLATLGLDWSQAAAMGDDWPDLPVMCRSAFACAPANAQAEVRHAAHFVTQARGGDGAARELCDLLLVASGRYAALLAEYTA